MVSDEKENTDWKVYLTISALLGGAVIVLVPGGLFWTFPRYCVFCIGVCFDRFRDFWVFIRFGGALLSHTLRCSTIGATLLNFRVRDGTGCFSCAIATKPNKDPNDASACRRCRAAGRVFTQ